MDNLASADRVFVRPGFIIPCIKILRGFDIASKQQGARFSLDVDISYTAGGAPVTMPTAHYHVRSTTDVPFTDPLFADVLCTEGVPIRDQPDAGTMITCSVKVVIPDNSGTIWDCSLVDTQVLPQSFG